MKGNDNIKQQIQSKLSDFEASLPQDGWAKIEQTLNAVERPKAIRRRIWYSGIAAAIAVLLVGGLFLFLPPATDNGKFVSDNAIGERQNKKDEVVSTIPDSKDVESRIEKANTTESVRKGNNRLFAGNQPSVSSIGKNRDSDRVKEYQTSLSEQNESETASIDLATKGQINEKPIQETATSQNKMDDAERNRLIEEFENAGKQDLLFVDKKSGKKEKPMMLAMGGKGGFSSFHAKANSPMMLRSASAGEEKGTLSPGDGQPDYASKTLMQNNPFAMVSKSSDNQAEMTHSQPISFGVTFSHALSNRFSIESGLVYTYLYSQAKNTAPDAHNTESQHFHYLGIPLNLNYVFASLNKVDFYGTIGGMVEKDIYGIRKYYGESQSETLNTSSEGSITEKISQEKPQFSVNAGLGLSYPITNKLDLYGKVGGAYYFNANNEYKTIYYDKKIIMDLNVGLRVNF